MKNVTQFILAAFIGGSMIPRTSPGGEQPGYSFSPKSPIRYHYTETTTVTTLVTAARSSCTVSHTCWARGTLVLQPLQQSHTATRFSVHCDSPAVNWTIIMGTNVLLCSVTPSNTVEGTLNGSPGEPDREIMDDVAGLYATGFVTIANSGNATHFSGSRAFRMYWGRWERMLPLVFATNPVPVGTSWSRRFTHPGLTATDPDLKIYESISTKRLPDRDIDGHTYSVFSITSSAMNLPGKVADASASFEMANSRGECSVIFDTEHGTLYRSISKHHADMQLGMQEKAKDGNAVLLTERTIRLSIAE